VVYVCVCVFVYTLKGGTNCATIIVGITSTSHFQQWTDHLDRKINKEASGLNSSTAHETISSVHHMLGHKTSLNKFNKIENMSSIFF
jgi:hypothetical protein